MALLAGDIVLARFCQRLLGEEVCMVVTLQINQVAGTPTLFALGEALRDDLGGLFSQAQSQAVVNEQVQLKNLSNDLDEATVSWEGTGDFAGEVMPRFVAAGIKLGRASRKTRPGAKRVPGIIESSSQNGVLVGNQKTGLEAVANWFSSLYQYDLGGGNTVDIQPVIVGRNADGSFDLTRINGISAGVLKDTLTTQNSRKR